MTSSPIKNLRALQNMLAHIRVVVNPERGAIPVGRLRNLLYQAGRMIEDVIKWNKTEEK